MLSINWADVVIVLKSVLPQLIVIGVALVLAVVVTAAINRMTVKERRVRKFVHSQAWLAAFVAIVVAIALMLFGPLSSLLTQATTEKYELSSQTVEEANALAKNVQEEAITLLKNDNANLPLSSSKVNVFGWASTNPVYGGTGSGSMSQQYEVVSLLDGLQQAGIEVNSELSDLYTNYRADRPEVGMRAQDWTLPEVPAAQYGDALIANAKSFSDEAVVVIARVGGEGADLPTDMTADGLTYTNNSSEYADFQAGESFLQLSKTERDMIDLVTANFTKVTLVYNGANTFQFDFLDDYPIIQSVIYCPPAGQTGFSALGEVLAGQVNPSGKTADTFVRDLKSVPSFNNFGAFNYDNMDEFTTTNFQDGETTPAFVNYVEGIYVGYRFYETASDVGFINYDEQVVFPFGYGLSYTTFSQEMSDVTYSNGTVSFEVTVTNTGSAAGKDVVEVYYNPPYFEGGIEKSSANLVAFEKTDTLAPGASQTIAISFADDDMASYDYQFMQSYVLEAGDYQVSIRSDSHDIIDEKTVSVADDIVYNTDADTHNGDLTVATNLFDAAYGENITYLSRANGFANYAEATAAPTNYSLSDELKATFYNLSNYDPTVYDDASDVMPTTGAKNGLSVYDMVGKDYDDPDWDLLLDQLTFDDMNTLIALGGYGTQSVKSVGKIALTDLDGPASLNNNFTGVGSIGFPASTAFACTWNKDLSARFGDMIGQMAHEMHAAGWYAPAQNIHRNPFAGRTFEYFSEDPLLSGAMASEQIKAVQAQGVYAFMKHFAMNEQETHRLAELNTWSTEQAIREIYLKPFEMSVKEGGAKAVMSAFNYIGTEWAGSDSRLLNDVLRGEWGFEGFVLTDYFGGYGYQSGDRAIRGGNDAMLATTSNSNYITDTSATSVIAMRTACHNILFTAATSYFYAGDSAPTEPVASWKLIAYGVLGLCGVIFLVGELLTFKRWFDRRRKVQVQYS